MAKRHFTGRFKPKISLGLPKGAKVLCSDNTGARIVEIIAVGGYKGRLRRLPAASVGDLVTITVKKGSPELRRQVLKAVVIRQKMPYRRKSGEFISFQDNAVAITDEAGNPRGSEIRGPLAREAAERWPRLASAASIII